jgi:hypothetical protein
MKIKIIFIFIMTLLMSCGPVNEPKQSVKQGEAVSSVLRLVDGNYISYSVETIKLATVDSTGTYFVTIIYSDYILKVLYHYEVIKISISIKNKETL